MEPGCEEMVCGESLISLEDLDAVAAERDAAASKTKEYISAPKHLLKPYQVFSIIANRMIGTGIFDAPTAILRQDRNIGASLIFWALGCLASMAGTYMFVEYGLTIPRHKLHGEKRSVPRSGGELNYLNYLVKKPIYLATCVFGWVFIVIGNSAANCISCAVHLLAAGGISEPHYGVVQAIALGVSWSVFLVHTTGRMFGVHLNSAFAFLKVLMLLMIILLSWIVLNNSTKTILRDRASYANLDLSKSFRYLHSGDNNHSRARGYATAYLDIIFTFAGFNQANYVLGEIEHPACKFKRSALCSVGIISILYMLVNIAYMIVVPVPRDSKFSDDFSICGEFFRLTIGKVWNDIDAVRLKNVCLAVSSLGNVVVNTFTAARVKQEIAKEGILPFSLTLSMNFNPVESIKKCFKKGSESQVEPQKTDNSNTGSITEPIPSPALMLHGVFSSIMILVTLKITPVKYAYPFLVGLYSYTINAVVIMALSFGMICNRVTNSRWNEISKFNRGFSLMMACLVFLANSFPVAAFWIPASKEQLGTHIPWFVVPTAGCALVLSGFFYWFVFHSVVPLFMSHRVLFVRRSPVLSKDAEGNFTQIAETVMQKWEVPEASSSIMPLVDLERPAYLPPT